MSTVSVAAEQLSLFDRGIDLGPVRQARERLMESSRSPNTVKAYAQGWSVFSRWCEGAGRVPCPAIVETVSLFVAWAVDVRRYRLETVRLCIAAVADRHRELGFPSPIDWCVRELVSNAARSLREEAGGKASVTPDQLRLVCSTLSGSGAPDVRDRSLLLLGFATGFRRSEIVSLRFADVSFLSRGLLVHLRASKTDQQGKGRDVGIARGSRLATCPVRQLRRWMDIRGDWRGPLFCRLSPEGGVLRCPISGQAVCEVVKRSLHRVGVDPDPYGAHSLRAGMATAGAENGASLASIMQRGGWKSTDMVLRYIRPSQAFAFDPLAGVL